MDNLFLEKGKFGSIWLALTYNCNNKCKWCYASSNLDEFKRREFKVSEEENLLRLLEDLGINDVKLVGGEPTLYKNIIHFLKKLTIRKINTTLVTNGRRLSDRTFSEDIRKAGLEYASFSIEGYDDRSHDEETCISGSFAEAIQGMSNSKDLGIRVATNTTITSGNKKHLERIVDFLSTKSDIITFSICEPWFRSEDYSKSVLSPLEGAKEFERVYRYAKEKRVSVKLTTPIPICNFSEEVRNEMQREGAVG